MFSTRTDYDTNLRVISSRAQVGFNRCRIVTEFLRVVNKTEQVLQFRMLAEADSVLR